MKFYSCLDGTFKAVGRGKAPKGSTVVTLSETPAKLRPDKAAVAQSVPFADTLPHFKTEIEAFDNGGIGLMIGGNS